MIYRNSVRSSAAFLLGHLHQTYGGVVEVQPVDLLPCGGECSAKYVCAGQGGVSGAKVVHHQPSSVGGGGFGDRASGGEGVKHSVLAQGIAQCEFIVFKINNLVGEVHQFDSYAPTPRILVDGRHSSALGPLRYGTSGVRRERFGYEGLLPHAEDGEVLARRPERKRLAFVFNVIGHRRPGVGRQVGRRLRSASQVKTDRFDHDRICECKL